MQVSRNKRREIRQVIYYIDKFGIESHLSHINETRSNYLAHLYGLIQHCIFVNPNDKQMKACLEVIKPYM